MDRTQRPPCCCYVIGCCAVDVIRSCAPISGSGVGDATVGRVCVFLVSCCDYAGVSVERLGEVLHTETYREDDDRHVHACVMQLRPYVHEVT